MAAPKKYGLIIPKKSNKQKVAVSRPSIFGNDSDEEDPHVAVNKNIQKASKQAVMKRKTQLEIEKALEDDPTVYEYDSIYDDMQKNKPEAGLKKKEEPAERKSKYIHNLLRAADVRKREQERRTERQVQKEREKEKGQYDDSESFVTGAYKKKLKEMEEDEEKERRREEMEAKMDVTKQRDLSGFYRHLLNQTTGEEQVPGNVPDSTAQDIDKTSAGPSFSADRDMTPSDTSGSSDSSSDSDSDTHRKSRNDRDKRSDRRREDDHRRRDRDDDRHRDRQLDRGSDRHTARHSGGNRDSDKHRESKGKSRDEEYRAKEQSKSDTNNPDSSSKRQRGDSGSPTSDPDRDRPTQGPQLPTDKDKTLLAESKQPPKKYSKHTDGDSLMDARARFLARKKSRQVALAPDDD